MNQLVAWTSGPGREPGPLLVFPKPAFQVILFKIKWLYGVRRLQAGPAGGMGKGESPEGG